MHVECYHYVAGEVPEPFVFQVLDYLDNPENLSDSGTFEVDTVTFEYRLNGGPPVEREGDKVQLANGFIGWTPVADDFAKVGFLEGTCYYASGPTRRVGGLVNIRITQAPGAARP